MKRPVYRLTIDIDDEGMDFMGLVDMPAHSKNYITMSKAPKKVEPKFQFNEEKRIVTGVAIATDLLIFRRDPDGFEYDVYFSKADTLTIMKMFAKKGYHNNVNLMHDSSQKVRDTYLIESYFINDQKSNIPKGLENQNLQPGTLIFSYWVEGDKTWEFIKEHGAGFSIEGWFREVPVKFLKSKQSKMKKSLFEKFGFKKEVEKAVFDSDKKDKYETAQTTEGDTVYWDGELVEGNSLFVVPADGGDPVLAPEGDHSIEIDGVASVVSVDEAGIITAVVVGDAQEEEEEEEEMSEEVAEVMEAIIAEYRKKFDTQGAQIKEMAKTIDEQSEFIEQLAEKQGFKKVELSGKAPGWKEIKNNNKK